MRPIGNVARSGAGVRIADLLRDAILRGELAPGARIRQEDLAARYGASRVPVREALRLLEADGLVRLVANTGAWVTRLNLDECIEIYLMREQLEPLLLRYSAPKLNDDDIDELEDLARRMQHTDDVEEFLLLDRVFHLRSYARADTAQLGELVNRLWNTTQHYRRAYTRLLDADSHRILHDEHHMLTTALRERDTVAAEHVLLGHIRRTRHQLSGHPEIFDVDER